WPYPLMPRSAASPWTAPTATSCTASIPPTTGPPMPPAARSRRRSTSTERFPAPSAARIAQLAREIDPRSPLDAQEFREMLRAGPARASGVWDGGRLIGAMIDGVSPVRRDIYGIVWLGVAPEAQERGVGSALVREALEAAGARRARRAV